MQRDGDRFQHGPLAGGEEVGLRFERRGALPRLQVHERADGAERVGERHDRAAVHDVAAVAEVLAIGEFRLAALATAADDLHAHEFDKGRSIPFFHVESRCDLDEKAGRRRPANSEPFQIAWVTVCCPGR